MIWVCAKNYLTSPPNIASAKIGSLVSERTMSRADIRSDQLCAGDISMASGDHQYTLMLAEKALEKIRALSLPADPSGYELWYSYAAGWHPEMNRRINRVLEENGSLPLSELGDIYDEYLSCSRLNAQADRTVTEISGEIELDCRDARRICGVDSPGPQRLRKSIATVEPAGRSRFHSRDCRRAGAIFASGGEPSCCA